MKMVADNNTLHALINRNNTLNPISVCTVTDLFSELSIEIESDGRGGIAAIIELFDKEDKYNVYVSDKLGYTSLLCIKKFLSTSVNECWIQITCENGMSIIVLQNHKIPVYFPESSRQGFHGQVTYDFKTKEAKDIKLSDILFVNRIESKFDSEFSSVVSVKYISNIPDKGNDYTKYGYSFITKSGTMLLNGIEVCACDKI